LNIRSDRSITVGEETMTHNQTAKKDVRQHTNVMVAIRFVRVAETQPARRVLRVG
jgi:hypothetical protein